MIQNIDDRKLLKYYNSYGNVNNESKSNEIMSGTRNYVGRLIPVDMSGLSLDEKIQEILNTNELEQYYSSWLESLQNIKYEEYYCDHENSILYEIIKKEYDIVFIV